MSVKTPAYDGPALGPSSALFLLYKYSVLVRNSCVAIKKGVNICSDSDSIMILH